MRIGDKVICINDSFPLGIEKIYDSLPKKNVIYVVREVSLGVNFKGEAGEVAICLIGLDNPRSTTPPHPERGFNSERFRPLDHLNETEESEIKEELTV